MYTVNRYPLGSERVARRNNVSSMVPPGDRRYLLGFVGKFFKTVKNAIIPGGATVHLQPIVIQPAPPSQQPSPVSVVPNIGVSNTTLLFGAGAAMLILFLISRR